MWNCQIKFKVNQGLPVHFLYKFRSKRLLPCKQGNITFTVLLLHPYDTLNTLTPFYTLIPPNFTNYFQFSLPIYFELKSFLLALSQSPQNTQTFKKFTTVQMASKEFVICCSLVLQVQYEDDTCILVRELLIKLWMNA
jgi:hypothetical protein